MSQQCPGSAVRVSNELPGAVQWTVRRAVAVLEALEDRRLLAASPMSRAYLSTASTTLRMATDGRVVSRPAGGYVKVADDRAGRVSVRQASVVAGGYQIEVRFPDSTLSPSQQAIFTSAAARWQQVILGDQSNITGDFFGTGTETIDDLVIQATGPAIDGPGKVLGSARPTNIRNSNELPFAGEMQFDSADLANLEASGRLDEVILHEMGHVIGLGPLWSLKGLITGSGGTNPRFTGVRATQQYQAIFGVSTPNVPVENTGGSGTANTHWREGGGAGVGFGPELMTGFLDGGVANPLSRVTIGQFADLGYTSVNFNAFDVFVPPEGGNAYPTVGTLSASPNPTPPNSSFTLTAASPADSDGSIASVRFYRESNGVAGLQVLGGTIGDVAGDTLLATDTSPASGYSAALSTTGLANGTYTYYAQATDNQNLVSVSTSTTHTVSSVVVSSATPGTPNLALDSDTGTSGTDDLTNRDNSAPARALDFSVAGTVSGATVSLYSGGTFIGSAVASGTTTTVTTNGSVDLIDGIRSITARQTEPGKTESAASAALAVTIDTDAPSFSGSPVFAFQTVRPQVTFNFSEPVATLPPGGFASGTFSVSKAGSPPSAPFLTATRVASSVVLTFPASPNGVLANGNYTATANGSLLTDAAGNAIGGTATVNFFVLAGDADRNRVVNFNDFLVLQADFNTAQMNFSRGDFDYNGVIDFNDFLILQANFNVTV